MLTDTHCHLDLDRFDGDREAVIQRAQDAEVERILVPGLDLESSVAAIKLAERCELVFAAVGVHPNDAGAWEENTLEEIRSLAGHQKVVAIGEIGLDYYWDRHPRDLQQSIFRRQLGIAGELGLPVVVHNRESDDDVVEMLLAWQAELARAGNPLAGRPGVLHSFSAGLAHAHRAIAANFHIGITGPITFKNAPELRALVKELPLVQLLVETDSPFLSPHPFRGQRNEPARVRLVAEAIAEVKNLDLEEVVRQTGLNADRLFGWGNKKTPRDGGVSGAIEGT